MLKEEANVMTHRYVTKYLSYPWGYCFKYVLGIYQNAMIKKYFLSEIMYLQAK